MNIRTHVWDCFVYTYLSGYETYQPSYYVGRAQKLREIDLRSQAAPYFLCTSAWVPISYVSRWLIHFKLNLTLSTWKVHKAKVDRRRCLSLDPNISLFFNWKKRKKNPSDSWLFTILVIRMFSIRTSYLSADTPNYNHFVVARNGWCFHTLFIF
jgi:hypothetical protein